MSLMGGEKMSAPFARHFCDRLKFPHLPRYTPVYGDKTIAINSTFSSLCYFDLHKNDGVRIYIYLHAFLYSATLGICMDNLYIFSCMNADFIA